jgi:hypothetical protein
MNLWAMNITWIQRISYKEAWSMYIANIKCKKIKRKIPWSIIHRR